MSELSREEVGEILDRAVLDLLESVDGSGPSVDAVRLAAHLGIEVKPERRRAAPSPVELSGETRQVLAAQAIGRHFQEELLGRLGVDPEQARGLAGSSVVNLFAD